MPFARKGQVFFVKDHSDSTKKFSETDIVNMLFNRHHICYVWWMCFSTDNRHMCTNCAPLLADFLYSYEANFIQGLLKKNEKKLARSFNFTMSFH